MRDFEILIRIPGSRLAKLLSEIPLSYIESIKPTGPSASKEKLERLANGPRYVGGKRLKGISGPELALKLMSENRIYSIAELKEGFTAHGFAGNSVGPTLTSLKNLGKVSYAGHDQWAPLGTIIKKGASA